MSSRNAYLSDAERKRALSLSRSLFRAQDMMASGERDAAKLLNAVRAGMAAVDIDYVELVDANTLEPAERVEGPVMLAVAAQVGNTRLIDNIRFDPAGKASKTFAGAEAD